MRVKNHRFEGVEFVPTTKKGGGIKPVGIVFHYTAGWTTPGDIHTLAKSERPASAHLVLARDGTWTQIVPFNVKAWHAGPSQWPLRSSSPAFRNLNNGFIGIEVSNIGWIKALSNGNFIDPYGQQITPAGQFVGQRRKTPKESPPPGKWPEFRHPNLGSGKHVWEPYPAKQLDALEEGVAALIKAYPTIKYFVGHDEIDTRGWKTDPGPMMPMERYRKLLERRGGPEVDDVVIVEPPPPPPSPRFEPILVPVTTDEEVERAEREAAAKRRLAERPWYSRWDNIARWTRWK